MSAAVITCALRLEAAPGAPLPTAAWLIRGSGPLDWLNCLAAFDAPLDHVHLLPLPHSRQDPRPAAVLAIGLPAPPAPIPRVQPYACDGGMLYLPVHSRLAPAMQPEELRATLDYEYAVLHPGLGLFGYQADDIITVAGLLAPPPVVEHDWSHAHPGIIMNQRLTDVELIQGPEAQEIIEEGRDDIGTEPGEDLPPAPGEPRPGAVERVRGGMQRAVSGGLSKMRKALPGGGGNWLNALQSWSNNAFGSKGRDPNESAFAREAKRLLHMLEKDPDQGLRHALPCAGPSAHRGVADAAAPRLDQHNVEFDIDRLGGARPVAPWGLPWEIYQQLQRRYRELARRELSLGRHRRAAYIYAELLGDHGAAANVLQQGGHYREAALLYRDFLKQPLRAARCLEEGGLLLEAVKLYESEGFDETTGDLYARLNRPHEAESAWRRAVNRYQETGDVLAAARLLEQKIANPDEALAVLAAAWPYRSQAGECLQAQFDLLGRLGRHHHAADLIGRLRQDLPPRTPVTLAECLAQVTNVYPDPAIQRDAADLARVVVGQRLNDAGYEESRMLLNALQRSEPGDRLLARDIGRYRDQKRRERVSLRKPWVPNRQNPHLLARFHLPVPRVLAACARRDGFFVVGLSESREVVLVRGNWYGLWQSLYWQPRELPSADSICLDSGFYDSQPVLLADKGQPPFRRQEFPVADGFAQHVKAGTPDWLDWNGSDALRMAQGHHQVIWILRRSEKLDSVFLDSHAVDGALMQSRRLELEDPTLAARYPMNLVAMRNSVYLSIGPQLHEIGDDARLLSDHGDSPILRLTSSAPYTKQRLAVSYLRGGGLVWPNRQGPRQELVAMDMSEPLFAFTRAGSLIAISGSHGEIYDTNQATAVRRLDFALPGESTLAVTPGAGATDFAVFDRQGGIAVYRVEADT